MSNISHGNMKKNVIFYKIITGAVTLNFDGKRETSCNESFSMLQCLI